MSYNSPPNFFSLSEYIFIRLVTSREGISVVSWRRGRLKSLDWGEIWRTDDWDRIWGTNDWGGVWGTEDWGGVWGTDDWGGIWGTEDWGGIWGTEDWGGIWGTEDWGGVWGTDDWKLWIILSLPLSLGGRLYLLLPLPGGLCLELKLLVFENIVVIGSFICLWISSRVQIGSSGLSIIDWILFAIKALFLATLTPFLQRKSQKCHMISLFPLF